MGLTILCIAALVALTQAGPIQETTALDKCARQCTVSNKFNYEQGTTYTFKYDTEIRTTVGGASEDHAGLQMSATVSMDFITKCEVVIKLSDVTVQEHTPETSTMTTISSGLKELENNPLRLSFQDGRIEEICLTAIESPAITNIKRGILSVFQNNMDDISKGQTVNEDDVAGNCEAEYSSEEKGWYNMLIKKSKNLLGCTGRNGYTSAIQGIPYNTKSDIQSLPILRSKHYCEQDVVKSNGRLNNAVCREQHTFAPWSREDSGAVTHITQTLSFLKESKSNARTIPIASRTSLKFDHAYNANQRANDVEELEGTLMDICATTTDGVTSETPRLFTTLVQNMKSLEASDLAKVFQKIKSKAICSKNNQRVSKFFLDAIPMIGSQASLKMMTQLITSQEVSGVEADMWLTTLAFIQHPTIDMLTEVKPLLSMKTNEEKAMLSVSSLVHSLCRNNDQCNNILEVRKIISLLENKIGSSCKVTDSNSKTVLLALRAIGNAGFGTGAIKTLSKCIQQPGNPIEVQLSAIEAFRRMPCNVDKSIIMRVFTDKEEDSEIRIAAYKTLMECPSDDVLRKVKTTLNNEEVNQVGSYVWSHLTNLMESADPHKQSIRAILEDETLQKEFDMDKRKFSRNYEGSLFIEKLNTGATVEGDMIWSSKSFIPRSAMLNLTVDLFGSAINLFEIGGRAEGLEYFLESYFGPNGYFTDNDVQSAVDETAVAAIKSDKSDKINKRMASSIEELRGSLYMRVFGNELRYMNFQGLDSLIANNNFNFIDMLMKLSKDNDYQFSQSMMILDSRIIVPTSSGFPLNLTLNGTATVDMKASGKMDVMKMSSSPPSLDIHGIVRPSVAIEISSMMSVDAFVTKVGVKMVSSLHSNTAMQGKVTLAAGKILNVEVDVPEEKMEIISVKSSFFTVHRDLEREQQMITENRQEHRSCSGDKIASITGLEICGELQYPNASLVANAPYFPLTGPIRAGITLLKRDSLSGYKFEARSIHTKDANIVHMEFNTPKSKINRNFGIELNLNKVDGSFDTSFNSPWKKADFKGTITNTKGLKELSGKLNWDNSKKYEVKASVLSEKTKLGMKYTPSVVVRMPGNSPMDLSGSVDYAPWKLVDLDLTLDGLLASPVNIKSQLINKLKLISAKSSIQLSKKEVYSIDSSLQKSIFSKKIIYKPQISIRTPSAEIVAIGGSLTNIFGKQIQITGTIDKVFKSPITTKSTFSMKKYRRGRVLYKTNINFKSSPATIKLISKLDNRSNKKIAASMDLAYVIKKFARDSIKLTTTVNDLSTKSLTKGKFLLTFVSKQSPAANIKLVSNLENNKKHSEFDADLKYSGDLKDTNKQITLVTSVDRNIKSWSDATVSINGEFKKGNDIRIVTKLGHSHNKKSLDSTAMLRLNKNVVSTSLRLKDKSTKLTNMIGQFDFSLQGKTISLSQTVNETDGGVFTSNMNANIGKSRNNIVTTWKRVSSTAVQLTSTIHLHNVEKVEVTVDYDMMPQNYKASGSLMKGPKKYSASAVSNYEVGKSAELTTDFECPTRHVIANFETSKSGKKYISRADVRWNADRDDSERVTISSNGQMPSLNNIDGSITIQYPTRTIVLNAKHTSGKKYISHLNFQWDNDKKIIIDTVFGDKINGDSRQLMTSLKLESPFKAIESVDASMIHAIEASDFKTTFDVKWNPKNKLSSTLTIKRPVSLRHLDVELYAKTPVREFKSITASLKHNYDDHLSTIGQLSLNKQSAQVDISFGNKATEKITDVKGQLDIKSTFKSLKTASLVLAHSNNGRKMATSAMLLHNKNKYGIESSLKHRMNNWNVDNNGEITVTLPSGNKVAKWSLQNTLNDIAASTELTWGKQKSIFVKYSGLQDFQNTTGSLSSALEIKTPFSNMRDIVFQVNHEHQPGQSNSNIKITNEGSSIAHGEGKYLRENGKVTSSIVLSNPIYNGDIEMKLNSNYVNYPLTAQLDISVKPFQSLVIDSSFNKLSNGDIDSSLTMSIPKMEPVAVTARRTRTRAGIKTVVAIEYEPTKTIKLESTHTNDQQKMIKLRFTSPLTNDYNAEGSFEMSDNTIEARASIDSVTLSGKWSTSVDFNGLNGNIRVNTPLQSLPYSQITVANTKVNGLHRSSVIIEYLPQKEIKLESQYALNSVENMKISMELTTPFEEMPYSALKFNHRGDLMEFNNHGEIEYIRGSKLVADTSFSRRNGIQGSVSVRTPFTDDISSSISHIRSDSTVQSHGEVTWGKTLSVDLKHEGSIKRFSSEVKLSNGEDDIVGTINFSLEPTMSTTISLQTPYKRLNNVVLMHTFEGSLSKFTNHAEVSSTYYGTYSADVKLDTEKSLAGEISLKTPIKGYTHMQVSASHEGTWKRFQTRVELQKEQQKINGDVRINTVPALNVDISLETPFKKMQLTRLSINHEGQSTDFKTHAEIQINKDSSEIDFDYDYKKKMNMDLTVRSTYLKNPIKASLDHSGSLKRFSSKLRVKNGKNNVNADVRFAIKPSFNAFISIKTPFAVMKNQQLSLKHAGSSDSFKCNMQYKCNGKTYVGEATYDNVNSLKAEANIKGPNFKPINVVLSHAGKLSDFKSSAGVSMGKKEVKVEAKLNMNNGINGNIAFTSPFEGAESVSAAVSHAGSLNNFKSHAEILYKKKLGKIDVVVDNTKDIAINVDIATPFQGYKEISSSLKHTGTIANFKTNAMYALNEKKVSGEINLRTSPSVTGSASLKSSFPDVSNCDASFTHTFDAYKFNTHGEMKIGKSNSEIDASMNTENGYEGTLRVNSPVLENSELVFKHIISDNALNTNAHLIYNGENMLNIVSDLSSTPSLSGIVTISTAFEGFEITELSVHHDVDRNNFRSNAKLSLQGKSNEIDVTLNTNPDIQGRLAVRSPLCKDVDTSMSYSGKPTNFRSAFEYSYGKKSQIKINTELNIEGPISGQFEMVSPLTKNIRASFNHNGQLNDFVSKADVVYNGQKSSGTIALKTDRDVVGSVIISSPLMKNLNVEIGHYGPITNCRTNGDISYGGASMLNINSHLNADNNINGEIAISTMSNKIGMKVNHIGDLTNFKSNGEVTLNDKSAVGKLSFGPKEGSISITAPMIDEINAYYNLKGKVPNMQSNGKLSYGGKRLIETTANIDYPNNAEIILETPLSGFEYSRVAAQQNGIDAHAEIELNGAKHEADISFEKVNKLAGSVEVKSPMIKPVKASVDFTGTPNDFTSQVQFGYGNQKHEMQTSFTNKDNLQGSMTITSPLMSDISISYETNYDIKNLDSKATVSYDNKKMIELTISLDTTDNYMGSMMIAIPNYVANSAFNVEGQLNNFKGHTEASVNGEKAEIDIVINTRRSIYGSISVKSPFTTPVTGSVRFNGKPMDFTSNAQVNINTVKHEIDIKLNAIDALESKLTIASPAVVPISAEVNINGNIMNFKGHATLMINNKKTEGTMSMNIETAIEGTMTLSSPVIEPVKASFKHSGEITNFQSSASLEYGQQSLVNGNLLFKNKQGQMEGTLNLITPITDSVDASFSHTGQVLDFTNHAELIIAGEKTEGDMSFNFGSKLEGKVSASSPYFPSISTGFDLSGNIENLESHIELSYNEEKYSADITFSSRSNILATIKLTTPVQGYTNIEGKFSYTGMLPNVNAIIQLKTGRRSLASGRAQLSTNNGIIGQLSFQSIMTPTIQINVGQKGQMTDFTSNADLRYNGQSVSINAAFSISPEIQGSFTLTTPFTDSFSANIKSVTRTNDVSAHADVSLGSKSMAADVNTFTGNEIGGSITIKTPFAGFENMQGSAKYTKTYKGFTSQASAELSSKNKIQIEAEASWRQSLTASASIRTPFESLRYSKVNFDFEGSFPSTIKSSLNVNYMNKEVSVEFETTDVSSGRLSITTPFAGFENTGIRFSSQGKITDLDTDLTITYSTGKEITASLKNKMSNGEMETIAKMESPYTEDITFVLSYKGVPTDFSNSVVVTVGETQPLSSVTTFKLTDSSLSFDASLDGYWDEQKLSLKYNALPDYKGSVYAKLFGSSYSIDSSLQIEPKIDGKLALSTPFQNLRDISLSLEHDGNIRSFSTKSELKYGNNKKIEATVAFSKYSWRRLQTSLDIRTPFVGFEQSKASYRHSANNDGFECKVDMSAMAKDISGSLRASKAPLSAVLSITTPYEGFEQVGTDMTLDYGLNFYNTELNINYMNSKTISITSKMNLNSSPKIAHIKIATPFSDASELTLTHTGELNNFQSVAELSTPMTSDMRLQTNLRSNKWSYIDGSMSFTSQIKDLEHLKLLVKQSAMKGKYSSNLEASWAPTQSIIINGQFTDNRNNMAGDLSLTTPFDCLKSLKLKTETNVIGTQYTESFSAMYNDKIITDLDMKVDNSARKTVSLLMKSPTPISIDVSTSIVNGKYEGSSTFSKDIRNKSNAFKLDAMVDTNSNEWYIRHSCTELPRLNLDGVFSQSNSNANLYINRERYGYEFAQDKTSGRVKVILPSRSLQLTGSQNYRTTEGSFMWDADKDETKKIGFKSAITPLKDSVNADVTLMMPSIGKEVQLDSKMVLNKGNVIFDGKTELTYSKDSRKKFTVTSRLEDLSRGYSTKNYSFSLDISHPYTSVGVQLTSHLGKSDSKITGSVDVGYLTVARETKTFSVDGEINKLLNSVSLKMDTPVKRISINGNARLEAPFRVALENKYDNKRPLNTILSINPIRRTIDFQMNYDIENPNSEFHINAKYDNSSAVSAEVFHVVNRQRITDALVAMRLNNSHLLHNRIHWRPSMVNDLKEYSSRKVEIHRRQLVNVYEEIANDINNELSQKLRQISMSVEEEMEPLTKIMVAQMEKIAEMYETNEYYLKDITDISIESANAVQNEVEKINVAASKYASVVSNAVNEKVSTCLNKYQAQLETILIDVEVALESIASLNNKISEHAYNMTQHELVKSYKQKYNDYVEYLYKINSLPSHAKNMANQYTSAMYEARDLIDGPIMQQGMNAYKYWEVRENAESVVDYVIEWIKSEIEKEISDIQATIVNLKKTSVTVYDPKHGEIQMDIHLPFPLRSLDSVPTIDMTPYVSKVQRLIPAVPSVALPSTDVSTWLPPFSASASIVGDKITTFDGLTYNLGGDCTYLLARDFVDGNFSLVLNKVKDASSLHILADGKAIEITSEGKVQIANKPIELPVVLKDITVSSMDGHVKVNGAGSFEVDYYKDLNTYTIKVNGWYFGKTTGLLGTYDNEPSNDLMTSYGKLSSTADRFTRTWDIGTSRCR